MTAAVAEAVTGLGHIYGLVKRVIRKMGALTLSRRCRIRRFEEFYMFHMNIASLLMYRNSCTPSKALKRAFIAIGGMPSNSTFLNEALNPFSLSVNANGIRHLDITGEYTIWSKCAAIPASSRQQLVSLITKRDDLTKAKRTLLEFSAVDGGEDTDDEEPQAKRVKLRDVLLMKNTA